MKIFISVLISFWALGLEAQVNERMGRARQLEDKGDTPRARELLQQAAASSTANAAALAAYAEFLDRHKDAAARDAYQKLLKALPEGTYNAQRASIARRLVVLDMLNGDREAAAQHLEAYKTAGGKNLELSASAGKPEEAAVKKANIDIPGPMRSFARMAALSPDLQPDDFLAALARNVVTNGYQAASSNESLEQTEYLKLVVRYLSQARELEKLAGPSKVIRIENCESTQAGDLMKVLGYRMRGACGSEVVLETVNATRAFLTIDSGFPLAELEQALRTNRPFVYDFKPTQVPVLYGPEYWLSASNKQSGEFIDYFIADPSVCRLYLGLSKLDPETAEELRKKVSVQRIKAFAHVLDFFGAMFQIRGGKAIVPGDARSAKAWGEIAGVPPEQGAAFFERLMAKDDGWAASYFDALSRLNGPVKTYLTEPDRLKRFYNAVKGKVTSPGPARPVFRSNTDMMLLTSRLRLEPDGRPHIPGNLEIWRDLFVHHPHGKYDGKLTRAATSWKEPDDIIEALFALCRKAVENEPLKIFMALSDVNRGRAKPLEPVTADRLARQYRLFGSQYPIFAEASTLADQTIREFMNTAEATSQIKDQGLRGDTAGTLQALISLWQILCRQGSVPSAEADAALAGILSHFTKIHNAREVFDGGRAGVKLLLKASHSTPDGSPQDRMIDLLSGTGNTTEVEVRTQLVEDMIRIFESQRLISLKTLFDLSDNLEGVARGQKLDAPLVKKLAARIAEIQLPRAALSGIEKNALSFGYWTERHIENQRKVNLRAVIDKSASNPEKLQEARGLLAPFLRDTLVGLVYVHYAPPGAQILHTNPLFVRSHDFLGVQGSNHTWKQTEVFGTGWPSSAGGRLVGSLEGLPYALAEAEQNFLIPSREQALIWGDLVPQMILSAKIPRWWNVTPAQLRWVGMHMQYAEGLMAEAALDSNVRQQVVDIFDRQAPPARVRKISQFLSQGAVREALEQAMPSELFVLADLSYRDASGPLAGELQRLAKEFPEQMSARTISRAFGTPKPTLANTYQPELLNLRTFPTLMGYSSRIMAESWESNILYYAALADEVNASPPQLNLLIPEWTQQTVEKIFATHLEDWPALLRSLRLVGEDVRQKSRKQQASAAGAGQF